MVSPVNSPVLSLAGSQTAPHVTLPSTFRDPVPLGVRLYSIVNPVERWVTRWVDDISFRSVVPGGFASATITLRMPRHTALPSPDVRGFSELTELFRRVQIVDLRTMEIAWEGRIEDPARQVDPDTWQIGALGSMVAASDVSRPVFYIDTTLDNWNAAEYMESPGTFGQADPAFWNTEKDETGHRLITRQIFSPWLYVKGLGVYSWRWDSHGYDQSIARFTSTQLGYGSPNFQTNFSVVVGIPANAAVNVTASNNVAVTKTNIIGTNFTDSNQRFIILGVRNNGADYGLQTGEYYDQKFWNLAVQAVRRDRFGNKLTTSASYPGDYVTVTQVVEDVIGRFLVAGWYEGGINWPNAGSVRPQDVYIDASNTTHILQLMYPDGVTAADILNDLVSQVQPTAYWAIWESKWGASDPGRDYPANSGFRFEWATWPNNWGYLASSQDGYEGQPNGDDAYNFVFMRYPDTNDGNQWHVETAWTGTDDGTMIPELAFGGFTRAATVVKQDPTDGTTADTLAVAYRDSVNTILNAGTLTVRRPIAFYDPGKNSGAGAARMLDPWMIRPGKLIRITDLPPRTLERDVSSGTTLPSSSVNGTLFKVVATEYNSSDNSCRLELDQVTRWQVPTQISSAAGGSKTVRIQ